MIAAAEAGLLVVEYSPSAVKSAVAGYGRAPKEQVQRMVAARMGLSEPPSPPDAADARTTEVAVWRLRLTNTCSIAITDGENSRIKPARSLRISASRFGMGSAGLVRITPSATISSFPTTA